MRIRKVYQPYGECTLNLNTKNSYDSDLYRENFKNYNYYKQKECLKTWLQWTIIQNFSCYSTLFPFVSSYVQPCLKLDIIVQVFGLIRLFFYNNFQNECLVGLSSRVWIGKLHIFSLVTGLSFKGFCRLYWKKRLL